MSRPGVRVRAVIAGLVLTAVAACTPEPGGFRDTRAPIGATTRFDPLAFEGVWYLVASFAPVPEGPLTVTVAPEVVGLSLASTSAPQIAGFYDLGAPGELIPREPGQDRLIVMWVDEDFRTAAVGTPSGSFGAVLNRAEEIPADRAAAARDVFAFYGWDTSRLKRTY